MIRWVQAFIDRPAEQFSGAAAFWTAVTGTRLSDRRGTAEEFATLLASAGDPYLKLQGVGDSGGAHVDLEVDDVPAAITQALESGATLVTRHSDWAVLRSPAGLRFCLAPWEHAAVRPPVVTHLSGAVSRLDQVCLDVGPAAYKTEAAFWTGLTGWTHRTGTRPEYAALVPPPGLPVRLLLQRLDDERPATAHLDLACSDRTALAALHQSLGARIQHQGAGWIVLHDPVGGVYCLTGRDPHTGNLPAPRTSEDQGPDLRRSGP